MPRADLPIVGQLTHHAAEQNVPHARADTGALEAYQPWTHLVEMITVARRGPPTTP